jgi:hypothetical protein
VIGYGWAWKSSFEAESALAATKMAPKAASEAQATWVELLLILASLVGFSAKFSATCSTRSPTRDRYDSEHLKPPGGDACNQTAAAETQRHQRQVETLSRQYHWSADPRSLFQAPAVVVARTSSAVALYCRLALGDQVLSDLSLTFQPGQSRLLVHPRDLFAGGQTLARDRDDLAVGGRLLLQGPGRQLVQPGAQLRPVITGSRRGLWCSKALGLAE